VAFLLSLNLQEHIKHFIAGGILKKLF